MICAARRLVPALLAASLASALLVSCSSDSGDGAEPTTTTKTSTTAPTGADPLELLPLSTSEDRRIVDADGRDVLLRGANVNSLGEYWQGVPSIDATIPVSAEDWDTMAAHGFSVIRLLVTWSRVEPTKGDIDEDYLAEVDEYVQAAADHGMYSVIDMHQDAYTSFLSTEDPAECEPGTTPAKGWDGAPEWAVLSDGLSTCLAGTDRNSSPAVNRAWNHFYDDTDGIRTAFAAMWGKVAEHFAGQPEVAGYDLLNEPETSLPESELAPKYQDLLVDVIDAIRDAESSAPFDHIIFVEPTVPAGTPANGIVIPDPKAAGVDIANISGSVHNYSESIGGGSIEGLNDGIEGITASIGVPNWGGEYGFWDTSPETLEKARRYAADEDDHLWGGAWWQWRQSCGDPHAVQWEGGEVVAPDDVSTHLNLLQCPDNEDLGPNDDFLDILGRGYPRAAPGRLTEVRSDVATGRLVVTATATEAGGELLVWTPTADDADHHVSVEGLTGVVETEVDGGRLITAIVEAEGDYALRIGPA
ncbi:glycoside hydrolase family 5 protein [Aquihabitans daechungensis]|uniref:glycoside hydrolase family 5 protein n=1 Tax=Aquihabitans daechungensis TaxID=1052257 RepID=UPI003BA2798A